MKSSFIVLLVILSTFFILAHAETKTAAVKKPVHSKLHPKPHLKKLSSKELSTIKKLKAVKQKIEEKKEKMTIAHKKEFWKYNSFLADYKKHTETLRKDYYSAKNTYNKLKIKYKTDSKLLKKTRKHWKATEEDFKKSTAKLVSVKKALLKSTAAYKKSKKHFRKSHKQINHELRKLKKMIKLSKRNLNKKFKKTIQGKGRKGRKGN
eukprot:gene11288-4099_t